jgi:3-isopropylmalate/(R)-2-methylmalate dehydratase large subunit
VLIGKTVSVPTFIVPATTNTYNQLKTEKYEGEYLFDVLKVQVVLYRYPRVLLAWRPEDTFGRATENEVVISTTNRNFPGRMGS